MSASVEWAIPSENVKKYENLFENMEHAGDKVSGEVMSKFLRDTKLPVETLRIIWDLSDLDQDGYLDRFEFILTMHLVCLCLEGRPLPQTLPMNLVPPNKRGGVSEPLALMPPPSLPSSSGLSDLGVTSPSTPSAISALAGGPPPPMPDWAISKAEQTQYSAVFTKLDKNMDGMVTGEDVRDFFMHSNLPQTVLARIWDLVDLQHTGSLNQEQFIVAIHLVNEQIASRCSRDLPTSLPPALIPPSLRPVTLDSKEYEESNKLLAEIDEIRKECLSVEAQSTKLLVEASQRSTELSSMTAAAETLAQTALNLAAQRALAERYVADRSERRAALRLQLTEVSEAAKERKVAVETLRGQVTTQQISIRLTAPHMCDLASGKEAVGSRSQVEEVVQLRNAITDRKREETALLQQVAERRSRAEAVETENKAISSRNDLEAKKISNLESIREKLLFSLDQYAKLLAGDTTTVEPEEALIQQLTAAVAAEKEQVTEAGLSSVGMHPLPQMIADQNFASFFTSPTSESDKNSPFGNDPFSTGSVDAFGAGTGFGASAGASMDPFMPAASDPFSPLVKASSDHPKFPFDSNKFDAIFGSAPSESTDYPFPSTATNANNGGGGSGGSGVGTKKIPPPRPPNQPNVNKTKANSVTESSRHGDSPKSRFRSALDKIGGNGISSRGRGAFRIASVGGGGREAAAAAASMNEAEQMRWATRESRRAAQQEEKLRAQEEADLELALRLSYLEALARGTN
ncbi:Epidermal growth factor receptor substrate 15-like protein [Echinococcus granulosus]|uniref:Epidermal growth factor receptor substrate 15-like protein n=1 Tax=Echinococcus granulosus TaxID=6210 RepID=W6UK03_ECHGR|nr:Epidermal growth factor receptor substrate 15-like protein [Echinococcus granulosus]EUB61403.1 Epidermal growth factor receptor substrate 15-like protein [Echinococcus granulosus]